MSSEERKSVHADTADTGRGNQPLAKVGWRQRRRRIDFVPQMQWADCGAACVTMVLRFFGHHVELSEVVSHFKIGRDGISAAGIVDAGTRFGLRGRGVRLEIDEIGKLPPATVLHWDFQHFVVLERASKAGVHIVDPGHGHRFVPMDAFRKKFTGVAIVFEPAETFELKAGEKGRLWDYLRQLFRHRPLIVRTVVMSLVLRFLALALPIITGLVVDRVVPRSDHDLLLVVAAGLGAVVVFHFLSTWIRAHLLLQLRTKFDLNMTLGFLEHLVRLPYLFFQQRSAGDLMMRVNSNTTIRELLTTTAVAAFLDGALAIGYLAIMFWLSPIIAGLILVLAIVYTSVFVVAKRRYRDLMAQGLEAQARSRSYLVELIGGIETLKSSGSEQRAVNHWSHLFVDELNVSITRGRLAAVVDAFLSSLSVASPLMVLSYGAHLVMVGDLTLGTMLAVNALAVGFLTPLESLISSALQFQLLGSYIERINDVLSTAPEQDPSRVVAAPPMRGEIRVEDVTFSYGLVTPPAVRKVSFVVQPGSKVALVGRSGSGKSTLAKLLAGLYVPSAGRILYDGTDLKELDFASLRRQIGVVPQTPWVFGGSIRDNIALAEPTARKDQIVDAARKACLEADIRQMPMRYETLISDGGASLSGGQRQRLALARALVRRPAILLLDEATSALDSATERQVIENLNRLGATQVVVAHRLSTIIDADIILVMDEGRLVAHGTHSELCAQNPLYRELVEAQEAPHVQAG